MMTTTTKTTTTTLNDPVFGDLRKDEIGWTRKYDIFIFGENRHIDLTVDTGDDDPTPEQRETYLKFEQQKQKCIEDIEKAIYEYYFSILEEERANFGNAADEMIPIVSDINGLKALVPLDYIMILDPFVAGAKKIGFFFNCSWDPGHGLGVELTDNEVTAVDNQDILL